ncbi:hypothetical protein LPB41_11325 [Thalassospira sp. MA62]|nr:hypothetical protein [Thalassospira sp. MA62]
MNSDYKKIVIVKNGKKRFLVTYNNPEVRLKHEAIKRFLEDNIYYSIFTKAYRKKSSIYINAKAHMYNDIFLKYDIKNFFDSIDHKILVQLLHMELNKLNKNSFSLLDVATLVEECIIDKKGLPLGLITSPTLSNIYLKEFDNILYGKLKKMDLSNVIYTRYADDLTISFKGNLTSEELSEFNQQLIIELQKLLKKYKLTLNKNKISIINLNISNHVKVTGINIIKKNDNYRELSVGKKRVAILFDLALNIYSRIMNDDYTLNKDDYYEISKVKGLNSFILSIHKKGYENMLSQEMRNKIFEKGYSSLTDLISNLPNSNN